MKEKMDRLYNIINSFSLKKIAISISYEIKLEEEQSKKWVSDQDAVSCTKCKTLFGWTVRKVSFATL